MGVDLHVLDYLILKIPSPFVCMHFFAALSLLHVPFFLIFCSCFYFFGECTKLTSKRVFKSFQCLTIQDMPQGHCKEVFQKRPDRGGEEISKSTLNYCKWRGQ